MTTNFTRIRAAFEANYTRAGKVNGAYKAWATMKARKLVAHRAAIKANETRKG